jgi:hypothetical protein
MAAIPKLTEAQIAAIKSEMVKDGDPKGRPVRFQVNGQTLNISTGELQTKGINIIHQIVYWNFPEATSKKIATWLGAKAVFSN